MMRPETQKQIVKAFAMMYEDTPDMPLSELISKLQQLGGVEEKKNDSGPRKVVSDEQILNAMVSGKPEAIGSIRSKMKVSLSREALYERLNKLAQREKISKTVVHPRLVHWTKL